MNIKKGQYGNCIRLEEKLFKYIRLDILNSRIVNYVHIVKLCENSLDTNRTYCLYKAFVKADQNGDDWRTNKNISKNIDNIIQSAFVFEREIQFILKNFLQDWNYNTKLLEKYIDAILLPNIQDTTSGNIHADEILYNLERFEGMLKANSRDIGSLHQNTSAKIRDVSDRFVQAALISSYGYIKEKEKEIFSCNANDKSWWDGILDSKIADLSRELSPKGEHIQINKIINNSIMKKLSLVELELGKQTVSSYVRPSTYDTIEASQEDTENKSKKYEQIEKLNTFTKNIVKKAGIAGELIIMVVTLEIKWGYIFELVLKESIPTVKAELLVIQLDLENYCYEDKVYIEHVVSEQTKNEITNKYALFDVIISGLVLSSNWVNPLAYLFILKLAIDITIKNKKHELSYVRPKKVTNPSLVDIHKFMLADSSTGFIKLPSEILNIKGFKVQHDKYYSFHDILKDESLQSIMLEKYNSMD